MTISFYDLETVEQFHKLLVMEYINTFLVFHLETLQKHIFFLFGTEGYKNAGHRNPKGRRRRRLMSIFFYIIKYEAVVKVSSKLIWI
jgi:hypothetical protein